MRSGSLNKASSTPFLLRADPAQNDRHSAGLRQCSLQGLGVVALAREEVVSSAGPGGSHGSAVISDTLFRVRVSAKGADDEAGEDLDRGRLALAPATGHLSFAPL